MTIEELQNKTDEQLRVMCANWCGLSCRATDHRLVDQVGCEVPDYLSDLNASASLECSLRDDEWSFYLETLERIVRKWALPIDSLWDRYHDPVDRFTICASAKHRALAFIAVKQTDGKEGV